MWSYVQLQLPSTRRFLFATIPDPSTILVWSFGSINVDPRSYLGTPYVLASSAKIDGAFTCTLVSVHTSRRAAGPHDNHASVWFYGVLVTGL